MCADFSTCINVDYTAGSYPGENSFTITNALGVTVAEMTSGSNGFNGLIGFCGVLGCMDSTACNYDSTATTDDGSCYNNDLGCGCDQPAAACRS